MKPSSRPSAISCSSFGCMPPQMVTNGRSTIVGSSLPTRSTDMVSLLHIWRYFCRVLPFPPVLYGSKPLIQPVSSSWMRYTPRGFSSSVFAMASIVVSSTQVREKVGFSGGRSAALPSLAACFFLASYSRRSSSYFSFRASYSSFSLRCWSLTGRTAAFAAGDLPLPGSSTHARYNAALWV